MINIYVDNYTPNNTNRAEEIESIIEDNKKNTLICGINYNLMNSPTRMTYQNLFDKINEVTCDDDINVVCNLDILFDSSILLLNDIKQNQFVALSRYDLDIDGNITFEGNKPYQQDTWAWYGKCKLENMDYYLGVVHCDNRLAAEAHNAGYEVINPCKSIRTIHKHLSEVHPDDFFKTWIAGPYLPVEPREL